MEQKIIYSTIVGSKMHGLSTPQSDEDIRYITLSDLRDVISPFNNAKIKVESSDGDTESWELRHFVKYLTQGNPTCYEVIKSPLYSDLPHAQAIRDTFSWYHDSRKILAAHCGYADAQLARYLNKARAGFAELGPDIPLSVMFPNNNTRRIPKATVAAYRALAQGKQLLTDGDFQPVVKNYSVNMHRKLMEIKTMNLNDITAEWCDYHSMMIENEIRQLKAMFDNLPEENKTRVPNIEAIKDFLVNAYCTW